MRVTVRQLKGLIREAAEEAMEEMSNDEGSDTMHPMEERDTDYGESLQEAVAAAFRAGYRKGRASRR